MQFEYTHKAGSGIYTINFIEPIKVKSTAEDLIKILSTAIAGMQIVQKEVDLEFDYTEKIEEYQNTLNTLNTLKQ